MQWVFGVLSVLAFIVAVIDVMGTVLNAWHIHEIGKRVSVIDEVQAEHAEQLEEIQRAISKVE